VLVVGFDTATPAVSVALHDGQQVVSEAFAVDARRHGELLAPMIAKVMADAGAVRGDLTAVAAGVGPGPYTGLRVGVVTARVLGAVLGIPVYGVCTLDVIAAAAPRGREFLVATDARRKEVYWARYDATARRLEGPLVGAASSIPGAADLAVAGGGGQLYPEAFAATIGPLYPDARTLCELVAAQLREAVLPEAGQLPTATATSTATSASPAATAPAPATTTAATALAWPPLLDAEPLYLRRPDAKEPGPPKRVTPS
jgi:tRNA threonylcarbamoyl adenosine modification protein YeaZ